MQGVKIFSLLFARSALMSKYVSYGKKSTCPHAAPNDVANAPTCAAIEAAVASHVAMAFTRPAFIGSQMLIVVAAFPLICFINEEEKMQTTGRWTSTRTQVRKIQHCRLFFQWRLHFQFKHVWLSSERFFQTCHFLLVASFGVQGSARFFFSVNFVGVLCHFSSCGMYHYHIFLCGHNLELVCGLGFLLCVFTLCLVAFVLFPLVLCWLCLACAGLSCSLNCFVLHINDTFLLRPQFARFLFVQAAHPWRSSLACMPHFTEKMLSMLKGMNIECLPELIERRDQARWLDTPLCRESTFVLSQAPCTKSGVVSDVRLGRWLSVRSAVPRVASMFVKVRFEGAQLRVLLSSKRRGLPTCFRCPGAAVRGVNKDTRQKLGAPLA